MIRSSARPSSHLISKTHHHSRTAHQGQNRSPCVSSQRVAQLKPHERMDKRYYGHSEKQIPPNPKADQSQKISRGEMFGIVTRGFIAGIALGFFLDYLSDKDKEMKSRKRSS